MSEFYCSPVRIPSNLFELGLGDRLWDLLLDQGIRRTSELLSYSAHQLITNKQISRADVEQIRKQLASQGVYLAGDGPAVFRKRLVSNKDVGTAWDAATPNKACRGVVYFIHNPLSDRMKIGYTKTLGARIADLETGSGVELRLVAALTGNQCDERLLHKHFSPHRLFREWFAFAPVLEWLQLIQPHAIMNITGSREVFREWKI